MDTKEFLRNVITAKEGWFALCTGGNRQVWSEEFFRWPEQLDEIVARADFLRETTNVYFSSYLFNQQRTSKEGVVPTRTIQADLDDADIYSLPIAPTVLVRTSANRHQAYWVLDNELTPDVHEILSKKITYSINLCDRSGWPLGRKVRLPGTYNYKYLEGRQLIEVVSISGHTYREQDIDLLPELEVTEQERYDSGFSDVEYIHNDLDVGPLTLLESIKDKIPNKVYLQYSVEQEDRSAAIWALQLSAFRAGMSRDEVFYLAWNSANNKFKELQHNAKRELAKDVLRAETFVRSGAINIRDIIITLRKNSKSAVYEKHNAIFQVVLATLQNEGEFFKTPDDTLWYLARAQGRPVPIAARSNYLNTLLNVKFGLNLTETVCNYVIASIVAHCHNMIPNSVVANMSSYNQSTNTLLLHTGNKDVYQITGDSINKITDGAYGIIFPWVTTSEPFNPVLGDSVASFNWEDAVFGDLHNVHGMTPAHAKTILKIWTLFLLLRDLSTARPILAFFGPPGSGKSAMLRRIYVMLYGPKKAVGGITKEDHFDQAVSTNPFYGIDNADSPCPWLPDRLAQSAANLDVEKRMLWTDVDSVVQRRSALVGISAHNPKFGREDVVDRLLLLTFERLDPWTPEESIMRDIYKARNTIWGALIRDIQLVLSTPKPSMSETPAFRIADFAYVGLWIAKALGCEDIFRDSLVIISGRQKSFNLEEEQILVAALRKYTEKSKHSGEYVTNGALFNSLAMYAEDPIVFSKYYKSAPVLGKKLGTLHESLKIIFDIDSREDAVLRVITWRISAKEQVDA